MKSRKRRGDSEWDAWQWKVVWCGSGKMGEGPCEPSGWILVTPRPPHAPSTVLNCRPLELSAKQGQCLKCIPETVETQVSVHKCVCTRKEDFSRPQRRLFHQGQWRDGLPEWTLPRELQWSQMLYLRTGSVSCSFAYQRCKPILNWRQ